MMLRALPHSPESRRTRQWSTRPACIAISLALVASGCSTRPTADGQSTTNDYASGCLAGAVGAAILNTIWEKASGKKLSPEDKRKALAKAALGGCVLGLAATAVGKAMNERQRVKHEEEMQKEARRRALEQQQYASATQRAQNMPASTVAQRAARDAELERTRVAYQNSIKQPVQVDLGEGGRSTIQVMPTPSSTPGAQPVSAGCTDYSVLTRTASGQARQYETWCPNSAGQMVRTDVRETAS